jgi:hypothetical protein
VLKREIAATGEEIDNLVYEVYGIADGERKQGSADLICRPAARSRISTEEPQT